MTKLKLPYFRKIKQTDLWKGSNAGNGGREEEDN